MHGSRELEVTRKTKFRAGREEELRRKSQKKIKQKGRHQEEPKGFDMWGDDLNDGC